MSVYVPNLIALDAGWVRAHTDLLFPHAPGAQEARSAVWKTFVERREPDLASFRLLKDEYERDITGLESFRDDARRVDAVIRHLAGLYWSGHLSLDEGLLSLIVASVTDEGAALRVFEQLVGRDHVVTIARRQRDVERAPFDVGDRVDLCRESSSTTTQTIDDAPVFRSRHLDVPERYCHLQWSRSYRRSGEAL